MQYTQHNNNNNNYILEQCEQDFAITTQVLYIVNTYAYTITYLLLILNVSVPNDFTYYIICITI